jgi:hypothetical protein
MRAQRIPTLETGIESLDRSLPDSNPMIRLSLHGIRGLRPMTWRTLEPTCGEPTRGAEQHGPGHNDGVDACSKPHLAAIGSTLVMYYSPIRPMRAI